MQSIRYSSEVSVNSRASFRLELNETSELSSLEANARFQYLQCFDGSNILKGVPIKAKKNVETHVA